MGISVVILEYNGGELLRKAVQSVLGQTTNIDELVILNNGKPNSDLEKLKEKYPPTRIVQGDNEYQFIGGLNRAFKEIKSGNILFMENDVRLHPQCCSEMYLEKNWDIVFPKFYDVLGNRYKTSRGTFLTACFMMNKATFDFIGEFDTNLAPAYYEDLDYSIRAKRLGFKIKQAGKAIHEANYSFSKVFSKSQMSGWCQKNFWYVIRKHYLSRVFPFLYNGKSVSNNS